MRLNFIAVFVYAEVFIALCSLYFHMTDTLHDDPSIPAETRICFSIFNAVFTLVFSLPWLAMGVFMFVQKIYPITVILGAISAYLLYRGISRLRNRSPQLILNDKGIETEKYGFVCWKDVSNEKVIMRQRQFTNNVWIKLLQYDDSSGSVELNISDLHVSKDALEHMLRIYRLRYEVKKQATTTSATGASYKL